MVVLDRDPGPGGVLEQGGCQEAGAGEVGDMPVECFLVEGWAGRMGVGECLAGAGVVQDEIAPGAAGHLGGEGVQDGLGGVGGVVEDRLSPCGQGQRGEAVSRSSEGVGERGEGGAGGTGDMACLLFQDAIARTAQLPQAGRTFEHLTMRLRMFNAILQLDWAEAVDLIARENIGLYEAIRSGDVDEAARRWRIKVERSVRYMVAQLPQGHFDPNLWATIAGKPDPRHGEPATASPAPRKPQNRPS